MKDRIDINSLSKAAYINIYKTEKKPSLNKVDEFTDGLVRNIESNISNLLSDNRNTRKESAVNAIKHLLSICWINNINLNEYISAKV